MRFWRNRLPKAPARHTEENISLGHTSLVLVPHHGGGWGAWGCSSVTRPQSILKSSFGLAGVCGGTQKGEQGWVQAMHKHAQQKSELGGLDSHH